MIKRKVFIFKDTETLAHFAVKKWQELMRKELKKKKSFNLALSGGKTPLVFYRKLAGLPLAWDKIHIFLVDERFIHFNSPESNYRLIEENLLSHIDIPRENVHPIYIEETIQISAKKYEEEIKKFFNIKEGEFPAFDLIMLGLGEDGHTASLFSDDNALWEREHLAAVVNRQGIEYQRITLTLSVINNARTVIFLVTGTNKSKAIRQILGEKCPPLPASLVRPKQGNIFFFLDREAAYA